jgi:hypothetical protein
MMNLQLQCSSRKAPALCEDDNLYDDFNIDDMDLELENYKEIFAFALNHSEEYFENGSIDSLFERKDMSASAVAAEVLKSHHPFISFKLGFLLLLTHHLLHFQYLIYVSFYLLFLYAL